MKDKYPIAVLSAVEKDTIEVSLFVAGINTALKDGAFVDGDHIRFLVSKKDIRKLGSPNFCKLIIYKKGMV